MAFRNLCREVTDKILTELRAGAAPWVKPWSSYGGGSALPRNAVTERPYSGANVVLLWSLAGLYERPRFLTFKQALGAGGVVRKGEHGHPVYFVSTYHKRDPDDAPAPADGDERDRRIGFLKQYTVFNVGQCDGLPDAVVRGAAAKPPPNKDERLELADEFVGATGATVREGAGQAYYRPGADDIQVPPFEAFKGADHFYNVLFHELGHWTGAKPRLDRDLTSRFGDQAYAAEELVAELTAAFLCAEFAFDGDLRSAGYIEHWIALLQKDERAFFTAASKAQAAADYLRGLVLAERDAA